MNKELEELIKEMQTDSEVRIEKLDADSIRNYILNAYALGREEIINIEHELRD